MTESFRMPIIHTRFAVIWRPTDRDRQRAHENHDQTLERLADRGGVDWSELDAILSDEDYSHARDEDASRKRVHLILSGRSETVYPPSTLKWKAK